MTQRNRFVVISGCSSGGKSTLLIELSQRGYATVEEPGRRIVREELLSDGRALPWVDGTAFARRAITLALAHLAEACHLDGWVFFDRGVIDAAQQWAIDGQPWHRGAASSEAAILGKPPHEARPVVYAQLRKSMDHESERAGTC